MADNYEKMMEKARLLFCSEGMEKAAAKPFVRSDEDYFYAELAGETFRVSRTDGRVQCLRSPEFAEDADFSCTMTIYDLLTHENGNVQPAGAYCTIDSVNPTKVSYGHIGGGNDNRARYYDENCVLFAKACQRLGTPVSGPGDLAFSIPLFSFMDVQVRLWFGDEEFPPQLQIMVDKNILSFILFETVYYAAAHILNRIDGEMSLCCRQCYAEIN